MPAELRDDGAEYRSCQTKLNLTAVDYLTAQSASIGINSGPVVAGVIGRKKFIYDLWGEAVNLASRMESHGRSRTVQITSNTHALVKDAFDCEARGTIEVKGAGPMDVRHVIGRK